MAFEGLSERLNDVFKRLRGKGVLTESDIQEAMRDVRMALLEADVHFKVVKDFVAAVREKSLGGDVMNSLTPGQQVIKIVNDELAALMGGSNSRLTYSPSGFTPILLVGLQGTGKTTTCAKLAVHLKKSGKNPMMAACDIERPAAIDQLEILGEAAGIPVFAERESRDPVDIATRARKEAEYKGYNVLLIDTAGRLHADDVLMDELVRIRKAVRPHEILLVVDAMTGQDAVQAAESFNEKLGIDGIILTKLDGDTRGGAALSVKSVPGKPIKFIGVGEKSDALEAFHPERMASRILGMGDVMSLIEKAQETFDEEKARELETKIKKDRFTLEDFLDQFAQIRSMGGLAKIVDMLPGGGAKPDDEQLDRGEQEFRSMEAIIQSMTKQERQDPNILNASRRKRIAAGAGVTVSRVNNVIKRYEEMRKLMKQFSGGKPGKRARRMFPGF
ncbi:MAG TPA: signal recognition particle protein [Clostridiales bacterium]|nr:signal recognition particle protein [Clostridiales bacterium]